MKKVFGLVAAVALGAAAIAAYSSSRQNVAPAPTTIVADQPGTVVNSGTEKPDGHSCATCPGK